MRFYTVHAPEEAEPERFAFVKDGFSWPALFIPLLWILWHRMWVTLLGYVAFTLVIAVIDRFVGDFYATVLGIAGAVLLGLEGNTIRRLSLEARGWREVGETFGRNLAEAEVRFFGEWTALAPQRRDALAGAAPVGPGAAAPSDEPILGLFPEPER
jgi:hypothetical protein